MSSNDSGRHHEVAFSCIGFMCIVLRIILRNEIDQNRVYSIDSGC